MPHIVPPISKHAIVNPKNSQPQNKTPTNFIYFPEVARLKILFCDWRTLLYVIILWNSHKIHVELIR